MPRKIDMIGKRFGMIVVMSEHSQRSDGLYWNCTCDCGNTFIRNGSKVRKRNSSSCCGCNIRKMLSEKMIKHGLVRHPLYGIWCNMKARCGRSSHSSYHNYGGRGIKVCDEWLTDFGIFFDWATSNGWHEDLEIDRRDNNRGYSPDNCRMVTKQQNAMNNRRNVLVTYNGRVYNSEQIREVSEVSGSVFTTRLRQGWSVEDAVQVPKYGRR